MIIVVHSTVMTALIYELIRNGFVPRRLPCAARRTLELRFVISIATLSTLPLFVAQLLVIGLLLQSIEAHALAVAQLLESDDFLLLRRSEVV